MGRRRFLQTIAALAIGAASSYGYARRVEPFWVDVEEVTLLLPNLPTAVAGKRLAQISDIHLSPYFSPEYLFSAVALINQSKADWLILTGDYATPAAKYADGLVEPLRQLSMPYFLSFGNHDYWAGLTDVRKYLHETGGTILQNSALALEGGLWLAGVDDLWSGHPDLKTTLQDVTDSKVTLLLAHEPDFFDTVIAQDAPVQAQFSGHSHGGQVRLPTLRPGPDGRYSYAPVVPRYSKKYPIGLRQIGHRYVYTNRGLGVWPMPYRLNCRPEITIFTLTSL